MKKKLIALLTAILLLIPLCAHAEENDWYLETAETLHAKLYELVAFEGFAEYFTPQQEMIDLIDSWKTAMEAEPVSVKGYDLPPLELISEFTSDMENIPGALLEKIERSLAATLISQINGMEGVHFLAAASIPVYSEGYIMPDDFNPCIVLYEYENICVSVSFVKLGEGVAAATVQFASPQLIELLTGQ